MNEHIRHIGNGLLALFDGDTQIREIGVTPGWDFKDRDEIIIAFNNRMDRSFQVQAVADYAYHLLNDGESAPDYRTIQTDVDHAAKRYNITLSELEKELVIKMVKTKY